MIRVTGTGRQAPGAREQGKRGALLRAFLVYSWRLASGSQSARDDLRVLQFLLELCGLSHRSDRGPASDERAEHDIEIERVEAPPEERCGEQIRTNDVRERRAECELHGATSA